MKNIKEIVEEFPELFGNNPWNIGKSLISFGFEMSEHWAKVVYSHFPELSEVVKKENLTDFRIVQMKEKFGSLSIYTYGGNDKTSEVINKMREQCSKTCYKCGSPEGKFRQNRWMIITCDKCEKNKIN